MWEVKSICYFCRYLVFDSIQFVTVMILRNKKFFPVLFDVK